jgi:LacI family transcriptional regulator
LRRLGAIEHNPIPASRSLLNKGHVIAKIATPLTKPLNGALKKRPTIKDVARQAGLSLSTVSLVINDRGYVSEETREKVLRVVKKLAYHPTRSARGLASQTSGNIGFVLTDDHFSQSEPFYTRVFLGTEFEARKHNYYILLTTVGLQFKHNGSTPRFLLERNVDGVIIAGKINEKFVEYVQSLGLPVVLVDYELRRMSLSAVLIDNRRGAALAVNHLVEAGHRDIGFIGGDIKHPSIAERFHAYKETLVEHGITPQNDFIVIDEADTRVRNGYSAMMRMIGRAHKPSAIFAANDAMAIGCMKYIKSIGMKIPDDIAIVGFDDIDLSSHVDPRLTTVRVFKEEMGKLAVQRMVEIVESKTQTVVTTHVPVELVVRESSGVVHPVGADDLGLPSSESLSD